MTTETRADAAVGPEGLESLSIEAAAYLQFAVPGVPYSAVRVPISDDRQATAAWIDRAIGVASYFAGKFAVAFPNAPREESRAANSARPAQPGRGGYQQREAVVYVDGEPCCGMHKTREGGPRPMRDFGDNFKCTAKKKDGSYCTNAVAKD